MNEFMHYATVSALVGLPALGVGIGQGIINKAALESANEQPAAYQAITRITIIALALSETAALLGVVLGVLLFFDTPASGIYSSYAYLGILGAFTLPAVLVGILSGFPGKSSVHAAARQPTFAGNIVTLLPLTQTMLQTPVIFGFVIALLIYAQLTQAHTLSASIRLLTSGLTLGLGIIGPAIGLARFSSAVCGAPGFNRAAYPPLRTFTFISQALIEAPVIFSVIVSLFLLMTTVQDTMLGVTVCITSALAISGATLGTGINSGKTAVTAVHEITKRPELATAISRASILSQTFTDTCAIYGLLIALIVVFVR